MNQTPFEHTGMFYYEPSTVGDHGSSVDEETFEFLSTTSKSNLCDSQDETCSTDGKYFTDDSWAITYHCQHHLDEFIKSGAFVKNPNK